MHTTYESVVALVLFVLLFSALGLGLAYHYLRVDAGVLKGERDALVGVGRVLLDVLIEVRGGWAGMVVATDHECSRHVELGRHIGACLPSLYKSLCSRPLAVRMNVHRLSAEDFVSAGVQEHWQQIEPLLDELADDELSRLWATRRISDLMAMLRQIQSTVSRIGNRQKAEAPAVEGNPLLRLLRDRAAPATLCEEVRLQMHQLSIATGRTDDDAERGLLALKAVVDVMCHRRDQMKVPFTLGVLVLAVGSDLERVYRECTTDADSPGGNWRPEYHAIRDYVESLAGWDGRLPFHAVTRATHNAHVAGVLRVLLRVA